MTFIRYREKTNIIIFGGYNVYLADQSSVQMQKALDDMWVYKIESNIWMEVFHNSDLNPEKRYGASLVTVDSTKMLLYGGFNSKGVFNELWFFNIETNMWTLIANEKTEIKDSNIPWPLPVRYATLVKFSEVILKIFYT
jgi:hypothetical protein